MPILFDEAGQAYEAEIAQQVSVDDLTAELSRLDDEYANVKANIQEKIDIITAHDAPSTTEIPQADPEATASDESKSPDTEPTENAQTGVIEDSPANVRPIDVPASDAEVPADPTPAVIQDITPAPAPSVTTVDESAPIVTTTDSTPEVTTVTDAPSEPTVTPTVIQLQ